MVAQIVVEQIVVEQNVGNRMRFYVGWKCQYDKKKTFANMLIWSIIQCCYDGSNLMKDFLSWHRLLRLVTSPARITQDNSVIPRNMPSTIDMDADRDKNVFQGLAKKDEIYGNPDVYRYFVAKLSTRDIHRRTVIFFSRSVFKWNITLFQIWRRKMFCTRKIP